MDNQQNIVSVEAAARLLILVLIGFGVSSCGQSGPLFLPKEPAPIKARSEATKTDDKNDARPAPKADPSTRTDPGQR